MRLSIERNALLKALGHVQNVVERRNTIPILSNVLMSAEDGQLSLVATDLDIEVSEAAEADVSAPGQSPHLPIRFMILRANFRTGRR